MTLKSFIISVSIFFFISQQQAISQNNGLIHSFFKLSFPEKKWVIFHPFVAKKAWKITQETLQITEEIKKDTSLDGDNDGGQVDAFRHTFWMASLSQKISSRKARKLGIAHEKANYISFKKNQKEENSVPDAASSDMDFRNNDYGIFLGSTNKNLSQKELINLVKKCILDGKVWILNKNKNGESLDCNDDLLPKEKYFKKWENPRCLVRSNKKRN